MIDERQEELAALYALDLLEGAELSEFQTALDRNPALQALVHELRETTAAMAHTVPAVAPSAALRDRVLASIETRVTESEATAASVITPPASIWRMLPWMAAACFALVSAWLGQRYIMSRSELALLVDQQSMAELALKQARQQLEAERIVNGRQIATLNGDLTAARSRITEREGELAVLSERLDALTGATNELGKLLADSKQQIADLTRRMQEQSDLAELKITTLASMLNNSPQALAVAVWDPAKQEGILRCEKLPALAANQDYQLWIVDPQYPNPVDGGVFTVDPASGEARFHFHAKQPVNAVNAFAVTRERKGGVPKAEGPFVLLGK